LKAIAHRAILPNSDEMATTRIAPKQGSSSPLTKLFVLFRSWLPWEPAGQESRRRLAAEIVGFRTEHEARKCASSGAWADQVDTLLEMVGANDQSEEEAWACFHAALRLTVMGMSPAEIRAEQMTLLAEGNDKLTSWRLDAMTALLSPPADGSPLEDQIKALTDELMHDEVRSGAITSLLSADRGQPETLAAIMRIVAETPAPETRAKVEGLLSLARRRNADDRVALARALLIRDEEAFNVHRRARIFKTQVMKLIVILALVSVALVVMALAAPIELTAQVDTAKGRVWAYAFLFGGLGGALSALQRTTRRSSRARIPDLREHGISAASLPLAGAAAGLAAIPLAAAGVIPINDQGVATLLAVAFVAGFSERLVVRAAETIGGRPAS
jgi:hypothetical protein